MLGPPFILSVPMVRWITSLFLLLAFTGQVWAGVCACTEDHGDSHSCCKPDKSGKSTFSAKPCCSSDCESISGSQIPGKKSERVLSDPQSQQQPPDVPPAAWFAYPLSETRANSLLPKLQGDRLKLARPPDALYLRHHSFLI